MAVSMTKRNVQLDTGEGVPVFLLRELLHEAGYDPDLCPSPLDRLITGVTDNSRRVLPGNIFVAIQGSRADGHLFLSDAVECGAAALIVEREIPAYPGVLIICVPDTRDALALLSHAYYGNPSRDKLLIGVTGTNGKTTTTYILRSCLQAAGIPTGLIGTIQNDEGDGIVKAQNTTPSALSLARMFARMGQNGLRGAVMEVSSHAIQQKRILGSEFKAGVFTNLTQDHLDYHGTMEAYREAKWRFFEDYIAHNSGVAAFNMEDETGRMFAGMFKGEQATYGMRDGVDVRPERCQLSPRGTRIILNLRGEQREICTGLVGRFNVMNILAASAGALAAGIQPDAIAEGISRMKPIPGRFELVDRGQPFAVIVDYAHTPDALARILSSALDFSPRRIITVFGCGGDRDRNKRPLMAMAVGQSMQRNEEDYAIITNDNPRSEDPAEIARQAESGLLRLRIANERYDIILDRREAIRRALSLAGEGDIVIIAGKGHEDYQIIGGNTLHFDDREAAREILAEMG
jgi:UDP-N-acetylmuramoyl-L-alanyl-D-glutamate--2,6-diaminopimelate ligase